jgi:hypothetical protein
MRTGAPAALEIDWPAGGSDGDPYPARTWLKPILA